MKKWVNILILFLLVIWISSSKSQIDVFSRLDTNSILIGDQIGLEVQFNCPADYEVIWPEFSDTITGNIEIIKKTERTTETSSDLQQKIIRQAYTITSFDSGYYPVPPIQVKFRKPGDTTTYLAESDALLLEVSTVPVNMEADIKDIKEPIGAPFTFREAVPYILVFLGTFILGFLIVYFVRKRKKAEPVFKVHSTPKIPPHLAALEALEALRFKKLWQNGEIKQYHTELTDIIREYIASKFGIHAQEFTSDEIMEAVNKTTANIQAREKLQQTLQIADLVKFAKLKPLPVEHDTSLNNAIDFVKETIHLNGSNYSEEEKQEVEDTALLPENNSEKEQPDLSSPGPGKEVKDV